MLTEIATVYTIVLNWNGKEDTIACLESLYQVTYPNNTIIAIDNGSSDDSVSAIKAAFPKLILLENKDNLGYAGGNNVGIKYALENGADYIFILNNDTIVDSQVISCLIDASEEYPKAGILGSKIYYYTEPQKIWYAGTKWIPDAAEFIHLGHNKIENEQEYQEISETEYICGCALLIKAKVVQDIGLMDERYFLTWEETDWCYRAKKAGYQCLVVPKSKVWHKISASFKGGNLAPQFQYFWWRNRLLWIQRNLTFREAIPLYWAILRQLRYLIHDSLKPEATKKERYVVLSILQGMGDYLLRRFGNCPDWVRSAVK